MAARGRGINLLVPSEFGQSFWGKSLKGAVTSGRYVVIITEMIVVVAFLSRFKLDTDLNRLNSAIADKKVVLDSLAGKETEFKIVQKKVSWVNQILNRKTAAGDVLQAIVEKTPEGVRFSGIKFDNQTVHITPRSVDEKIMGLFLGRLNNDDTWKEVELTNVTEDNTDGLTFTVNIHL